MFLLFAFDLQLALTRILFQLCLAPYAPLKFVDYIFGLSGTKPLARKIDEVADDIRTRRAIENLPVLRGYRTGRRRCILLIATIPLAAGLAGPR